MRLLASGQLNRATGGAYRGHTGIQQWFRPPLDGPIAELERRFLDEREAA